MPVPRQRARWASRDGRLRPRSTGSRSTLRVMRTADGAPEHPTGAVAGARGRMPALWRAGLRGERLLLAARSGGPQAADPVLPRLRRPGRDQPHLAAYGYGFLRSLTPRLGVQLRIEISPAWRSN